MLEQTGQSKSFPAYLAHLHQWGSAVVIGVVTVFSITVVHPLVLMVRRRTPNLSQPPVVIGSLAAAAACIALSRPWSSSAWLRC